MTNTTSLPDLLWPGLDLVFVGVAPGKRSAQERHYYSHPRNVFWRMLSDSDLVDGEVGPTDDELLPARYGIGFTNVTNPGFERIAEFSPRMVCFNSKEAFDLAFPGKWRPGRWCRQSVKIAGAEVWVMPSTSGLASGYHKHIPRVLKQMAQELEARRAAS